MDTIALFGITLNSSKYVKNYGETIGWLKGIILVLFTFVFPNLFMESIIELFKLKVSDNKYFICAFCFFIVYLLDLLVNFF